MCTLISGSCTSYTIVGGVVLGASWYLYRLAMGPTSEFLFSFSHYQATDALTPSVVYSPMDKI